MARNDQNLRPVRTKEEARKRGANGGRASGEARRKKKTFREMVEAALSARGTMGETVGDDVVLSMIEACLAGDVKAAAWLRDTRGEKPVEKAQSSVEGTLSISWDVGAAARREASEEL